MNRPNEPLHRTMKRSGDQSHPIGSLTLKRFVGSQMLSVFDQLAEIRIQVFIEFPYLYQGSVEYEKKYLKRYSNSSRGLLIALYDGHKIVGAATALPLMDEEDFVKKPFLKQNLDISKIFYFGESVLLPTYRGRGLGNIFFNERENFARSFPEFTTTTFCSVVRSENHARRPKNYKPLDGFWEKRGYRLQSHIKSQFSWQDLDESQESLKTMQYWMKEWT